MNKTAAAAAVPSGGIDCAATGISIIRAIVLDSSGAELVRADFNCTNPQGTITGVPAGTNRQLQLLALPSATSVGLYQGTSANLTISPEATTDVGIVTLTTNSLHMTFGRYLHTATLLENGMVLVTGGRDSQLSPQSPVSAELFDPNGNHGLGAWIRMFDMRQMRSAHTATLLENFPGQLKGNVLIAGGANGAVVDHDIPITVCDSDLFNPQTQLFVTVPAPTCLGPPNSQGFEAFFPRDHHTATLLNESHAGNVTTAFLLVAGGIGPTKSAQLFDPSNSGWKTTGNLLTARWVHTATLLLNGKVLVAGGFSQRNNDQNLNDTTGTISGAELYDPTTAKWTSTADIPPLQNCSGSGRSRHTATLLKNGKVLIVGGRALTGGGPTGYYCAPADAVLFNPTLNSGVGGWETFPAVPQPVWGRAGHTATRLPDGSVLIAGGTNMSQLVREVERFDPNANNGAGAWTTIGQLVTGRLNHTATCLPPGIVLIAGGNRDAQDGTESPFFFGLANTATDSVEFLISPSSQSSGGC